MLRPSGERSHVRESRRAVGDRADGAKLSPAHGRIHRVVR